MTNKTVYKIAGLLLLGTGSNLLYAQTSNDFAAQPPLIGNTVAPNVMLVMSKDHEITKKAYTDYSDLDDDGIIDDTYNDTFSYTGYFDSNFCYSYNSTSDRFEPETDISSSIGTTGHDCSAVTGDWSGNFMNWATMTRMDIVRSVLFGGYRDVDTATSGATDGVTVLERAFIPEDAHAYVKVFPGDVDKYTPYNSSVGAVSLCNMTRDSYANDPLIRVAFGEWPIWASSERVQCHYTSERDSGLGNQPSNSTGHRPSTYEYSIRVLACEAGVDSSSSRCKAYTDSSTSDVTYKPVGLLQEYGDSGNMNFGLITGSYDEKISGGVLRKDILPLTGNSSASDDEIDLDNGTFINQGSTDGGIINTINRLELIEWNYSSETYDDCSTWGISKSTFTTSTSSNRQCTNWGNPLSEIYLEALRYFTGDDVAGGTAAPTPAFNGNDSSYVSSLQQLGWNDPLDSSNACATCSIIVLSTGLNSFDADELGTISDIWEDAGSTRLSASDLDQLVDDVGDLEGISNGSYLVGSNGTTNDEKCTAKTITDLSDVEGICPEIPSLEGGFDIAGLAYHAHLNDLRDDFEGVQSVNTFSVALAENLPSFDLDVNGNTVRMVPTCESNTNGSQKLDQGGWNNCSFLNVTIEEQDEYGGSAYISWEDSMWGSDFDMDGISRIEWCIGDDTSLCPDEVDNAAYGSGYSYSDFDWETSGISDDTLQIRTSGVLTAAGYALRFGYTISGVQDGGSVSLVTNSPNSAMNSSPTTSGGKYIARGTLGNGTQTFLLVQGGYGITRLLNNSGNRIIYHEPAVYTATASVTTGELLENPLWYTAKYGSFNDIDGDGTPKYNNDPDDTREWDNRDTLGNEGADGIPDSFYPVRDPSELITNLGRIFEDLSERISSGTAAAVVTNSSSGLGAVYQAYYHPQYSDDNDNVITWGGVLHSIFIDESGRFREDNGIKGRLEDTSTDYVVDIFFDETVTPNRTRFQRYTQETDMDTGEPFLDAFGSVTDLEDFGSIWNARNELADISQANLAVQRNVTSGAFTENAGSKRYIFTWLDSHLLGTQGAVDSGEVVDFTAATFNPSILSNNYRYLGISDSSIATDLVEYVRGVDKPARGWRSRQTDIPGDGSSSLDYWILGDIVNSSPIVVNPPGSRFNIQYGDDTYDVFQQQYDRRRQMIYVGGNDGMLHAFNGGVWDSALSAFFTQQYDEGAGTYTVGQSHELGAEMWAYVPMNLLPHLQWLREVDYPHVYYVDGSIQSFDVNIFTPDTTHPGGWGTILVATMRLGGGEFSVDLDGDASDDMTMRSAIVILDITDPEGPPELVAEISDPNLAYTTGAPALVKARVPDTSGSYASPSINEWILVYGSGPTELGTVTSNQDPVFFAYDLVNKTEINIATAAQVPASDPNGFFGDILVVDLNEDFVDDVIYIGTVEGTEATPEGRVKKIYLDETTTSMGLSNSGGLAVMSTLIDVNKPVTARPNIRRDVDKGEEWVLFGTGRLFTSADNRSTAEQYFIGVKETGTSTSVDIDDLVDTTDLIVKSDGTVYDSDTGEGSAAALLYSDATSVGTSVENFTELYAAMDAEDGWLHALGSGGGNPAERVFNTSLVLGSSIIFTSYLPSYDLCTVEGDGLLYAYNFRTGTAQYFGPFGESEDGIAYAGVDLGQGAPSAPTAIVRTGNEVTIDGTTNTADLSVVTGSTTGVTTSTGFSSAPGAGGRLSWEILDIPF
jgi:type IV pilus assembly protein PilY1